MTLFKQLALVISFIIIVMLGAVMYINYESAKKDMIESLYQTTVNNISTLANNLSESSSDTALLTTVIDAEFDSGYYKLIRFTASDKLFTYEQADNEPIEGIPLWFVNFTNLKTQIIKADVMSGWSSIGEVEVAGDTNIIYKALYKMFIKLLYLFCILAFLSFVLLSILLHFVLKPLKDVQNQAESILKNEFVTQKKEPYTTEFKDVVKGMNNMVKKVEAIFNKANEDAKKNRELLYNDPITKLYNRRYLMLKIPDIIKLKNRANGGVIIFIALSSLEIINRLIGHKNTDLMLQEFANKISKMANTYDDKVISRVNEVEFTLMVSNAQTDEAISIAKGIDNIFNKLLSKYKIDTNQLGINIGIYKYRPNITAPELLKRADNALSKAKADENINIHVYEESDEDNAIGKEQWRVIIENAIAKNHFKLKFRLMINVKTKEIEHHVLTFTINDEREKKYFYGDFIAPAIDLGLIDKIYLLSLENLMSNTHHQLEGKVCSVRLPNELLKDNTIFKELSSLLEKYVKTINFKLFFEISDSFATNNTQLVKNFLTMFDKYGINFGINSFTSESDDFSYLRELNPKFIKTNTSFLLDQSRDSINALHVITNSLGIDIIATFVKTEDELERLSEININKVQGPITDEI